MPVGGLFRRRRLSGIRKARPVARTFRIVSRQHQEALPAGLEQRRACRRVILSARAAPAGPRSIPINTRFKPRLRGPADLSEWRVWEMRARAQAPLWHFFMKEFLAAPASF